MNCFVGFSVTWVRESDICSASVLMYFSMMSLNTDFGFGDEEPVLAKAMVRLNCIKTFMEIQRPGPGSSRIILEIIIVCVWDFLLLAAPITHCVTWLVWAAASPFKLHIWSANSIRYATKRNLSNMFLQSENLSAIAWLSAVNSSLSSVVWSPPWSWECKNF